MKKICSRLVALLLLTLLALPARAASDAGKRGRFYVYGLESINWFNHREYSFTRGQTAAPLLGAGWRLFRFEDRLLCNVAVDFTPASFRFPWAGRQRIAITSLMFEGEWRLLRPKSLSVFLGLGGAWVRYAANSRWPEGYFLHEPGEAETFPVVAFEFGFKHAVLPSRKLLLRCGLRFQGEAGGDEYWDDWLEEWDVTNFNRINTQLLVGLEYHI